VSRQFGTGISGQPDGAIPAESGCSINTLLQIINALHIAGIFTVMAAENSCPGGYTVNCRRQFMATL